MCDATPQVLSAQVFAADGVTPVPGKGPLVAGADYALSYAGAPTCELTLQMLTPAAAIDTDQRLIVTYRTQLDADSQDGATLTNVAGATEWFDDESSNPDRVTFTRTLTDGTPGVVDHEDAHTVTVRAGAAICSRRRSMNVTTGDEPGRRRPRRATGCATALRIENLERGAAHGPRISTSSIARHTPGRRLFQPGTLTLVTVPAGADTSNTSATGGANGTGVLDVRNLTAAPGRDACWSSSRSRSRRDRRTAPSSRTSRSCSGSTVAVRAQRRSERERPGRPVRGRRRGPDARADRLGAAASACRRSRPICTGDPNVLLPGDTLRYTITVKNIGSRRRDRRDAPRRGARRTRATSRAARR